MFISMVIVSLLILFSFASIFDKLPQAEDKPNKQKYVSKEYIITSLSIYNKENESVDNLPYSRKAYYFYFMILKILTALITLIGMKLAFPAIKNWT